MIGPAKWAAQPDKTEEDLHEEQCQIGRKVTNVCACFKKKKHSWKEPVY
jgi:hypothetical protein